MKLSWHSVSPSSRYSTDFPISGGRRKGAYRSGETIRGSNK